VEAATTLPLADPTTGVRRLENLADGVFSIAMTLLVLDLRVPQLASTVSDEQLRASLGTLLPNFLSFILSFVLLGIYWIGHHMQFSFIRRTDRTHQWLNMLFLFLMVLVPFSAAMLGRFGTHRLAVIWYGGNIAAAAITLQLHWWYATHNRRLVDPGVTDAIVKRLSERLYFSIIVYPVAMVIALFSTTVSLIIYILVPIVYIVPVSSDFHWFSSARSPNKSE